jgi:hypothetical protein
MKLKKTLTNPSLPPFGPCSPTRQPTCSFFRPSSLRRPTSPHPAHLLSCGPSPSAGPATPFPLSSHRHPGPACQLFFPLPAPPLLYTTASPPTISPHSTPLPAFKSAFKAHRSTPPPSLLYSPYHFSDSSAPS